MSGDEKREGHEELDPERTIPMERPKRRMSGEVTIPISSGSREPTEIFEPDALEAKAVQGPLRRNLPLILVVLVVLMVSPLLSRLLSSYRAVVLEVRDGEMLLIERRSPPPPPDWVDAIDVEPGAIVEKEAGAWDPTVVEPVDSDDALLAYHRRWMLAYEGVITKIRPPLAPGGPSVAVVRLTDGRTLDVSLWAQELAAAAVGKGLRKRSGTWEPELMLDPPAMPEPARPEPPDELPDSGPEGAQDATAD